MNADTNKPPKYSQEEETNSPDIIAKNEEAEAKENGDQISRSNANEIESKKGSSGAEEKDFTD